MNCPRENITNQRNLLKQSGGEQKMNVEEKIRYLQRGVEELIEREELAWKIDKAEREQRSLVVKMGVDPTAPDIHLGHTVPLMKLRDFQEVGYEVTFLIGDFTGRIGDPTGRSSGRNALTETQVLDNAKAYQKQIFKILDPDQTKIVYNSKWLNSLKLDEFILLLGKGSVNEMIRRRGVSKRLDEGNSISVAEFVYPFLQAYDSVALRADVEIGGQDQLFNLIFGREVQRAYGQEPQVVITLPLLEGIDGKEKMSKSLDNHIGLDDDPRDMYGKIMSIPDSLIVKYFDLLTRVPYEEVTAIESGLLRGTLHARDEKARLAREIVSLYHDRPVANYAEEHFNQLFRERTAPNDVESVRLEQVEKPFYRILVDAGMATSNSMARRVIKQGGARIDGETIRDPMYQVKPEEGMILNVGKKNYKKITRDDENNPTDS